jgi:Cytochrome c554 and c-prime
VEGDTLSQARAPLPFGRMEREAHGTVGWMRIPGFGLCAAVLAASLASACNGGSTSTGSTGGGPSFTKAELMDPQKCGECHPNHYADWAGSMHAYAADDPVFVAMNARGQRETSGALGSFCVKCHAPLALADGATTDGLNLASLPASEKGVTCYFCHSVASVNGAHDDPLTLADDGVMRGGLQDPLPNTAHAAAYAPLMDRAEPASATLCGSCHDIVNPLGTPIERTFEEWQGTVFSHGAGELTCSQCHMNGSQGLAADVAGAPTRTVHSHLLAAVDRALTTFPDTTAQEAAAQGLLDTSLQASLCVKGGAGAATIQVVLDNVGAGHLWPSGATQDRRAWVEVIASASGQTLYQSGAVAVGGDVIASGATDPDLWLVRDCMLDAQGQPVNMFWQAASHDSNQLPGPVTLDQTSPLFYLSHVVRDFPRDTSTPPMLTTMPDTVTMRMRVAPIGVDVLDDLVASGDLDPAVEAKVPEYTVAGSSLTWTAATANLQYLDMGLPVSCMSNAVNLAANSATPAPEHKTCSP